MMIKIWTYKYLHQYFRVRMTLLIEMFRCHDHTPYLFVYGLMLNNNSDSHLLGRKIPFDWAMRYKIAMSLDYSLLYMKDVNNPQPDQSTYFGLVFCPLGKFFRFFGSNRLLIWITEKEIGGSNAD